MDAVSLELRTQCPPCGQTIPINRCSDSVACSACRRAIALDWQALLAPALASRGHTGTFSARTGDATVVISRRRDRASCASCASPLPDEVKQFAGRGWTMCPACGGKLAIRTPPPALAWAGVELVVAEELAPPPAAAPPPPVMTACLACRAPMRVDGAARIVRCTGCSIDNHVPDELWRHLHPVPPAIRWYLVGGGAPQPQPAPVVAPAPVQLAQLAQTAAPVVVVASRAQSRDAGKPTWPDIVIHGRENLGKWDENEADGPTTWSSLENVVMGPDGLFYCGGEIGWGDAVWCMGDDLRPRWVHRLKLGDIRVALDVQHGRVLAWSRSKHSALLLAMADGAMIGQIGGQEPENAQVHHLDMEACDRIIGDLDGTMLAMMGDRLLRYDAHGGGVATWPPHGGVFGAKAEKLESLFLVTGPKRQQRSVESVDVEHVGNHPTVLDDYARLHIARDGRLVATYRQWIAGFDRTGKRLFKKQLPLDSTENDPSSDAQGNLYVRGHVSGDPDVRQVVRVSPDGGRVDLVATDRRARGAVGSEDHLCVSPDGTIYLFDYGMRARIIGADGRLRWQSPKSLEQDAEDDQRAAETA